ncbi:vWA domain-containing protein [Pseudoxanthomonas wuyuanensis]|uniref:Ca-activated chloride channel family protein n=1 Tax=Pseudoxanthomonas wuyuanensis TaxID=1073196 RepID=A0A286CVN3_9GAMM|nr:VWA domain-containing protein [Pseudoxanthomonas wuyuanensis]KAF1721299.1 VWA domain-containing protein [Pseudoxanthomonas wuyuanensis]SOD50449.1 Ca-activated chloride channel family protein [Pseudoxanthomonas wuyuanensis]
MQRRHLCLSLLTVAVIAGCHSSPTAYESPAEADSAAAAAEAAAAVEAEAAGLQRIEVTASRTRAEQKMLADVQQGYTLPAPAPPPASMAYRLAQPSAATAPASHWGAPANTEKYAAHDDNPVHRASEQPLSTFSIDVDTGSYSNVRRMLRQGVRPPADAVRAEEFINYFDYRHPQPLDRKQPFRVTTELAPAPWNAQRQLLMIGIKGYDVPKPTLPPANLVFLIDTSGSMDSPDKLPLLKQAFSLLVPQLREQDRVSIVVYAGSAGLVLPPTPGNRHDDILAALDRLQAGGSTNGGDGIRLAYSMANQAFAKDGVNRVILATDGDFNVGTIGQDALETLVADQRKSGIALTTLGFGQGNYNDQLAERLADVGDGNHAYIDTLQEARKVLVDEMQSTLLTIAQDVKIQIEFNPAAVSEYRLIGYENRLLRREDFANDKVDAGDIGAGHEVTALYEITPVGSGADRLPPLRYGDGKAAAGSGNKDELAHLRLRYKLPGQDTSKLIQTPILRSSLTRNPGEALRFASAVAAYADLLRGGSHIDQWSWDEVIDTARRAQGSDRFGLRREFVELMEQGRQMVARDSAAPAIAGE